MKQSIWKNTRPILTVEFMTGSVLGRCYHGTSYKITSTRPLSAADISTLRKTGIIGYGQEFYIDGQLVDGKLVPVPSTLDWRSSADVVPSGKDTIEPKVVDSLTGEVLPEIAMNEYSNTPMRSIQAPYYTYVTSDRVDSSD